MKKVLMVMVLSVFLLGFVLAVQSDNALATGSDSQSQGNNSEDDQVIGGQKDEHGCLIGAGYSWNATEQKCVREWIKNGSERYQYQNEAQQGNLKGNITQTKNRLTLRAEGECPEECTCSGSTVKCMLGNGEGREMTITAGKSGNTIVQIKGQNMSTNVTLYKAEGKLYGEFKGNVTKEINSTPDQVREKLQERLKMKNCTCDMTLDENATYQIQTQKRARLFLIVPVKEKVQAQVSAENGEILRIRKSWWGFLARDVDETD